MKEPDKIIPSKVKILSPKITYEPLMKELVAAYVAVGELKGFLGALLNPDLLIAPFRKREAIASSAIEGTRATLEEVLKYEALDDSKVGLEKGEATRKTLDIQEIINYENAMGVALKELKIRPIGENLLKNTHQVLLDSVRGEKKNRGNFRKEQVMVGDYVPPVHTDIPGLMSNWEKYLNTKTETDVLIRIGVAHYQFEAIHPFSDGNGRIGRLIIPLFLCQEEVLGTPVLYISHYFEEYKVEYQRLLHRVDTDQDWIPWLKFFLTAVEVQAKKTTQMAKDIDNLYKEMKQEVVTKIKSQHTITFLDEIFRRPYITANTIRGVLKAKTKGTTYNLIKKFVDLGILKEYKGSGRIESVYVFSELLRILRM